MIPAPAESPTRWRAAKVGGCTAALIEPQPDGSLLLRSTEALRPYPVRVTDALERWAAVAPDRTFAARRAPSSTGDGDWVRIGYAQMLQRAQSIGQALLDLGLGPERPLAVLSENDLEHLSLMMGALWAGVPWVSISTAYSLVSQDFGKLRHIVETSTPGAVYASSPAYARAIEAVLPPTLPVILGQGRLAGRATIDFDTLLRTPPGAAVAAAHAAVGPDSIAKLLFTSGSTKAPKGVITTHRMWCANLQMIGQALAFLADEPPVLVDWLPWNHVFGGSHNIGIVLAHGGTLYIDDGKPVPALMHHTLRNLREISPTIYFNVPKGLEEITRAMRSDAVLRERLFARCQAFMFAGASLSQAVWDELHAHAETTVGERVRVITGLGMTETAPSCTFAVGTDVASGHIGLPLPGVEVRLVPEAGGADGGGKTEIRFRGPNVMPGYWRNPQATAEAFDADGFYRSGDAVRWIDDRDPQRGLRFDGRIAEDFKLSSGTFVSVGPLRATIIAACDPLVQDAVITGLDRNEVGALIIVRADDCRRFCGLGPEVALPELLAHPLLRDFFQARVDRLHAQATGSANRITRWLLLAEPPAIDAGEVTDKGSINQRAVLARRAALVDALYAGTTPQAFTVLPQAFTTSPPPPAPAR